MFDLTEKEKKIVLIIIVLILGGWFLNYFYQKKLTKTKIIISPQKENLNLVKPNNNLPQEEIIVDIGGEVNHPGVYKLKNGSRLFELIKKACGETKRADLQKLNLAAKLQDGEKIIVPAKSSLSVNTILDNTANFNNAQNTNSPAPNLPAANIQTVNINSATEEQLINLPGIGPGTAKKIIDYRNTHGRFSTLEDLLKVKGIGEKKFAQIKNYLTVN